MVSVRVMLESTTFVARDVHAVSTNAHPTTATRRIVKS
jgi:hypothetical protein